MFLVVCVHVTKESLKKLFSFQDATSMLLCVQKLANMKIDVTIHKLSKVFKKLNMYFISNFHQAIENCNLKTCSS
jgi:hypothetical protein